MTRHHPLRRLTHLAIAGVLGSLCVLAASPAAADELCEGEVESRIVDEVMTPAPATPTPCQRARDAGNYNLCFEANPYPLSTMPEWLAKWQAEEAVAVVFEQVNEIHGSMLAEFTESAPLPVASERWWLNDLMEQVQAQAAPTEQNVCVDTADESCQSLPPASAVIMASTVVPLVYRDRPREELRPHLGDLPAQPALAQLTVGPAAGYALLERPPPRQG